jgi:hypothetical protein
MLDPETCQVADPTGRCETGWVWRAVSGGGRAVVGGVWHVAGGGKQVAGGRNHDVGRYHSLNLIFSAPT